jgi:hypothetical protein
VSVTTKLISVLYKYEGRRHAYMPPRETLAAASSRVNSEALDTRVVLAYSHAVFHPCMCELCRDIVVVAAALIGYDNIEIAAGTTTRRKRS